MEKKFVILCCENIRPEIDAVLATGTMPRATAESYPFHCGHVQSVWNTVKDQVGRLDADGATTCLCGCGCANTFDIPQEILDSPSLVLVEAGASLFLPEALAGEFRRCGAYLILPGWLMRWKLNAERDGLDRATARQMFGESLSAIVLLDTGVHPGIEPVLAEFAEFTGLAARTLPVGLDHLRFRLEALYQRWECGEEAAACKASVRAAEKRVADYSMVADLTGMIIGVHDEKTVIHQVLDHFVRLCSPKRVAFVPARDGMFGTVISIPPGAYPEEQGSPPFPESVELYQVTETGDGFRIRVQYDNDLIGVLSVDEVSLPSALDEYLNLAHFIAQIAGLSITIARTHTNLMLAMKTRENEIAERIRVELALRESEEQLKQQRQDLAFKVRELNCLYEIGRLVETSDTTASLLQAIADILPSAGQYPDLTCARVIIDGKEFLSRAFTGSNQVGEARVSIHGKDRGTIEIFFRGDGTGGHLPVTAAETGLLSAIAERLGRILERNETEEALRESEEKYRTLVESSFDGIAIHQNGILVYVNQTAARLLGSENPGDFIGRPAIDIVAPAFRTPVAERIQQSPGKPLDLIREQFLRLDGIPIDVDVTTAPSIWGGKPAAYVTFRDITAQVRAESALRESEEKYRTIINGMQDIFYRTDITGKITMLSPSAAKLAGYDSLDQLLGKDVTIVYADPADRNRLLAAMQESGSVYAFPIDLRVRDGSIRHVTTSSHFFRDPQGTIAGVEGVIHDITSLRKTEDALRESEEKYRALVETTSDFIWEVDADGRYTYVSPQVYNLLGYHPQEMMGKTPFDLMSPRDALRIAEEFNRLVASHLPVTTLENQCLHKDGHTVILETSGVPRFAKNGTFAGYRGIDRDITKRKHAEEALLESEGRYRGIIENIQDVFFRIDRESRVVMLSPSATRMFGVASPAEILGKPVVSLWKRPEQRTEFLEAMKNGGGAVQDWEAEYVKSDGTAFWVSISAHLHLDESGNYAGTEGIVRDISERKKMEEALKGALKKLNMLSSITRHDILNQIMGLRTFLELSKEDLKGTKHEMFIDKEDQAAEAIQRQIEFTKYYQDIGVNEPKWQDAGTVIKEAAGQLSLPSIELQIGISNVEIFADPLIVKVFFNLMENSLRHGERVTQISFSSAKSVEGLVITYRDNGAGISAEDKKKLFQRGFGKHTGLGLFLSREILAITGITITENGEPGKGVQFDMTVPYGAFRSSSPV